MTDALPRLCRLLGHGWRRREFYGAGWYRKTCDACRDLDYPAPSDQSSR